MRESATCSLCGHGYTYPAGLDEKAGMHCTACGVLIHVKTGLPFGEAPSSPSGQKPENAVKTPASLPPVKKKQPASSGRDADGRDPREASRSRLTAAGSGTAVPAVSWLGMGPGPDCTGHGFHLPLLRERLHGPAIYAPVPALHGLRLHGGHSVHSGACGHAPLAEAGLPLFPGKQSGTGTGSKPAKRPGRLPANPGF